MDFFRKTKGAVSIFLIMILLPTLTIAGVFLDVSRVKLSEEVAITSADLALNTVLSDYDKTLKDYFGLMGSCQNVNSIIDVSKNYFKDCMVSAGVPTSVAIGYADSIMSSFIGDEDISDSLRLSVEGDVELNATKNGSLKNPAVLKNQIVEFMKYRAPVNGVLSLFEDIKDSGVAEQADNVSKETEMTEKKKAFYNAEKKLLQKAEEAYEATKEYQNYVTWTGKKISDEDFLNTFSSFLSNPNGDNKKLKDVFKEAHQKMVKNLYNTHDTSGNLAVNLIERKNISTQSSVNTYSENNKASLDNIKTLLTDFNTKLKTYISQRRTLATKYNNVRAYDSGSDYVIQYWKVLSSSCKETYEAYVTAANNLWKSALKIENAMTYVADGAVDELLNKYNYPNTYVTYESTNNGKLSVQSIYDTLFGKYESYYKGEITSKRGCTAFQNVTTQISRVATTASNDKLKLESVSNIYNIRNKLNKYQVDFGKAYKLAENAKKLTAELKTLLEEYKKAFEEWETVAFDPELDDSEIATKPKTGDRALINELKATGIEYFSEQSVTDMTNRLGNIMTFCKTLKDAINAIKYKSTKVVDISGYTKFRTAAALSNNRIVRNNSSLNAYVNESFSFTISAQIQRIEIHENRTNDTMDDGDAYVITDSFNPDITQTKLELYDWMVETFSGRRGGRTLTEEDCGYNVSGKSSAKDANKEMDSTSENVDDVNTDGNITSGKNFSEWSGATLPSKDKGAPEKSSVSAKISAVSDYTASIFKDFSGTFLSSVTSMRDDLYMLDYCFEMFTHDTFYNEGCYDNLEEEAQKKVNATNTGTYYTATIKENWEKSSDFKTLTLTPRNAQNNWAYGSEIEYILYGNKSNAVNKTTAYANIYMIRYAMDLAPVFSEYWNDPIIEALALSLQAFAFIPVSLTKTIACLAITAGEAAVDIATLKKGIPVIFIKGKDDLVCNYENIFMGGVENQVEEINDKFALQYSDYLKIFFFIKLIGKDEALIYVRTADVIQANMTLASGESGYALSKARAYFDLSATVLVEPMWSRLLAIDNMGDLSTAKGWRSYSFKLRRGY